MRKSEQSRKARYCPVRKSSGVFYFICMTQEILLHRWCNIDREVRELREFREFREEAVLYGRPNP